MGPLLGQVPSKELVDEIERRMLAEPLIVGVHDLIIHDYGPGRVIASAHAEVPADQDIMAVHNAIDRVEHQISKELQIVICIHMDPIAIHDATVDKYRKLMAEILQDYDPELRFHDFRLVECSDHMNLIMDIVVPKEHKKHRSQILKEVQAAVQQRDPPAASRGDYGALLYLKFNIKKRPAVWNCRAFCCFVNSLYQRCSQCHFHSTNPQPFCAHTRSEMRQTSRKIPYRH